MTPAEQIEAAFKRFNTTEGWDFDSIWPILSTLLVLGVVLLVKKWTIKEHKVLKAQAGIKDDKQDKTD